MRTHAVIALLLTLAPLCNAQAQAPPPAPASSPVKFAKLAPFSGLKVEGEAITVLVDGSWLRLTSIDGHAAQDILAFCRARWPDKAQKRFGEDLVEVLSLMGHPPGATVRLVLVDAAGAAMTMEAAPMTAENRQAVLERNRATADAPKTGLLGSDAAGADLDALAAAIGAEHSYATRLGVDWRVSVAALRARCVGGIDIDDFAIGIAKILAPLGDGHARVRGLGRHISAGDLPVALAAGADCVLMLSPDGLADSDRPCLVAIDGEPVAAWLSAASSVVPAGSPQLVHRRSVELLRHVGWLRAERGKPAGPTVAVTVAARDGSEPVTHQVPLGAVINLAVPPPPRPSPSMLEGGIAYLRIEEMSDDPAVAESVKTALAGMASAKGLVLDLRGNGGGSRRLVTEIVPLLLPKDSGLRVVNVASYRRRAGECCGCDGTEGCLDDRFLHVLASSRWTQADRAELRAFAERFRPEWALPAEGFSPWHYMALRPAVSGPRWEKPVVVLMDAGCFSATDVFLAALKGLPQVTLMGEASSGGSGRVREHVLANSGLRVMLSTMASFRADGSLYDGRGIEPDVTVQATPSDVVGRTDSVLAAAVARLPTL